MKHYSQIIKKVIDENNKGKKNITPNHKENEKMNSATYTLNNAEYINLEIPRLNPVQISSKVQKEIERYQYKTIQALRVMFKITSQIIRFSSFLIRIIYNSITHSNLL